MDKKDIDTAVLKDQLATTSDAFSVLKVVAKVARDKGYGTRRRHDSSDPETREARIWRMIRLSLRQLVSSLGIIESFRDSGEVEEKQARIIHHL